MVVAASRLAVPIWRIVFALGLTVLMVAPLDADSSPARDSISATVVSLRNDRGRVVCSLFDPNGGFPRNGEKALRQVSVPIHHNVATCDFAGIPPGTYALTVFHDENANGRFDMSWLGLPLEGYGFSNDASAVFAPPSFGAASFRYVSGSIRHLIIHMRY